MSSLTVPDAALLGLVEGLTEYLPVSSTGHLILVGHWLGEVGEAINAFDVVVQLGAVLAVLGLYRRRVGQMLRGLVGGDVAGRALLINLMVAFVPAAVAGLALGSRIKEHLFAPLPVAGALAVGGVAMIALDRLWRVRRTQEGRPLESLAVREALIIGVVQCLAMWPGTSRSLVTILAGLGLGLTPLAAAEFSFLLALPTLGAACAHDLLKHHAELFAAVGPVPMAVGLGVAFLSAAVAVKGFVAWLVRHGFMPFGLYRILLAVAVVVLIH